MKITETERAGVVGADLTGRIGIDADEIAWRKEYTQFTDEDAQHLVDVGDVFEDIADELVEEFYQHLQTYDETIAILDSSCLVLSPTDGYLRRSHGKIPSS